MNKQPQMPSLMGGQPESIAPQQGQIAPQPQQNPWATPIAPQQPQPQQNTMQNKPQQPQRFLQYRGPRADSNPAWTSNRDESVVSRFGGPIRGGKK